MQGCYDQQADPPPPPSGPDAGLPAAWFAGVLVVALVVFELWALLTHHNTVSHWTQRLARRGWWIRGLLAIGIALLGVHLIWGF